jgi:hypothetical protein
VAEAEIPVTKLYRVTQTRVALVRAVDPEEAIRIERDRGTLTGGAIEVTEITGDELARIERERAPRSPSTFDMQAQAMKRPPSGTFAAVRPGRAYGLFQVQPAQGIALDGGSWRFDRDGFHGRDMVRDRKIAIRVALHLMRGPHDPRWTGGDRAERADAYANAHPFTP